MSKSQGIPDDLITFFGADPRAPIFAVRDIVENPDSPVFASLSSYLESIPDEAIMAVLKDAQFRSFAAADNENLKREARIWIAECLLTTEIPRPRNKVVRNEVTSNRPDSYNVPAMADLKIDSEHLVPLSAFEFDGCRLLRNGHASHFCQQPAHRTRPIGLLMPSIRKTFYVWNQDISDYIANTIAAS